MSQVQADGRDRRWEQVLRLALEHDGPLHDTLHVTALLEKAGWSDRRASQEFGYDDLFAMAEEVYWQANARVTRSTTAGPDPYPWYRWIFMGLIYFLRGMIFAMPMIISVFAMLQLRYSLWSYVDFDVERATGIAIGTIASFLVTGGFGQAIARRGLFYISMKEFALSRQTTMRFMIAGMMVSLLVAAAVLVINLLFPFFSWRLLSHAAPYYLFLCLLWLTITILYMMQREVLFTAITAAGIATVWFLYGYKNWLPIQQAQMVGLGLSTVVSLAVALFLFSRAELRTDAGSGEVTLPRWSQVSLALLPFFVFGILYFSFLFLDRVMAWSVPAENHPYPIWFLGDYELGLDWAILTLVTPLGILELFINLFSKRVEYWQARTRGIHWPAFNLRFRRTYVVQVLLLIVLSSISAFVIWMVIAKYNGFNLFGVTIYSAGVTDHVFRWSATAYVFVAVALLNCLMLFCLNVPWPAVRSVSWALLVNVVVGFLCSRFFHYSDAVFGLLAGSVVFAALSSRELIRYLTKLDYVLYRSL